MNLTQAELENLIVLIEAGGREISRTTPLANAWDVLKTTHELIVKIKKEYAKES